MQPNGFLVSCGREYVLHTGDVLNRDIRGRAHPQTVHHTSQILELLLAFHYDWENETILPGALRHFKDIKHVWLLFCTHYIAWIFQWILGDEGRGKWWDRQYRVVDPPVCCVLDVTVTYARESFVDCQAGPFVLSRGGGGGGGGPISWHQAYTRLTPYSNLLR